MEKLVIIGTSKTAKHLYDFVIYHKLFKVIGFAVNSKYKSCDLFCNLPVFDLENLEQELNGESFKVFVAMLWNKLNAERRKVYEYCKIKGYKFVNIISPLSVVRSDIKGDNCWIHDFVVIQNDTIIESDVMIMSQSLIGANSKVGSHCFFGAKSLLGGGSIVGEQSFIGLNATVFDDTIIGKKCIIGACSSVKRNMPDFSKCIISSDNVVIKQYSEDTIENKLLFLQNKR